MEYRQTNNSHTRGARVHAYAVRGLLRPLRWGYASLLVLELCFTVRADTMQSILRLLLATTCKRHAGLSSPRISFPRPHPPGLGDTLPARRRGPAQTAPMLLARRVVLP